MSVLIVALFPGLSTIQFLIACSQSKTGRWEGPGMRLVDCTVQGCSMAGQHVVEDVFGA